MCPSAAWPWWSAPAVARPFGSPPPGTYAPDSSKLTLPLRWRASPPPAPVTLKAPYLTGVLMPAVSPDGAARRHREDHRRHRQPARSHCHSSLCRQVRQSSQPVHTFRLTRGRIGGVDRLAFAPDTLADLVHSLLGQAGGGWSMGVQGALAEFAVPGIGPGAVAVRRSGRTVEAHTAGGGLRLTVTDETQAIATGGTVYLAVPRSTLRPPAAGLTVAEADPDALRPDDGHDLFVDLAVGHAAAAFCIRTADPDLGKRLRAIEGAGWPESLAAVGPALVAASPHRIVTTPLGRIEVYAAIPADDGASPEGPHTHLLPPLLRTGRELPAGVTLPAALAPAAAFHPPPGWAPPLP